MILEHIDILNFKNIRDARLDFCDGVRLSAGEKRHGEKQPSRSHLFPWHVPSHEFYSESALILHGEEMLMVKGQYSMDTGLPKR